MIPLFTEEGFLPEGLHFTQRKEFRERFAVFDRSDRRLRIYDQLENLFDAARASGIV